MAFETQNYDDFQPQNEEQKPSIEASLDALWKADTQVTEAENIKQEKILTHLKETNGEDSPEFRLAQLEAVQVESQHIEEARDIRKPKIDLSKEIMNPSVDTPLSLTLEQNFWPGVITIDEGILDGASQSDALQTSKNFINKDLSLAEREQFKVLLTTTSRREQRELKSYFSEHWYPVDQNDYLNVKEYFELEDTQDDILQQEAENTKQEAENTKQEADYKRQKELYLTQVPENLKDIAHIPEVKELLNKIESFKDLDASEFGPKILDYLSNWPDSPLYKILTALKQEDKKNGNTKLFDKFSSSLVSIDQSFEAKLIVFEASYNHKEWTTDFDSLPDAQILWAIPEWATEIQDHDPDTISFKEEDGTITKINTKDGTVSTSVDGGWYEIKNKLPTADFYGAKVEHEAKMQEIQPQLNTIWKLTAYIQELPQALTENFPLKKVKEGLIRMATAGWLFQWGKNADIKASIINAGDLNDIKTTVLAAIMKAKQELDDEKEDANNKYIARLKKQLKPYSERIEWTRNEKKVVLQNLKEMWVLTGGFNQNTLDNDIIPHIDNPTTSVTLKSGIVSGFSLNPFKIEWDLSLPDNPIDKDGNMDQRYRVILAELFNKMLSGDSNEPIDLNAINSASSSVIMKQNGRIRPDETAYVNELLGDYPTQRVLENLEKPEPEEV